MLVVVIDLTLKKKASMRTLVKLIEEVLDTKKTDRISKTFSLRINENQNLAFKAGIQHFLGYTTSVNILPNIMQLGIFF